MKRSAYFKFFVLLAPTLLLAQSCLLPFGGGEPAGGIFKSQDSGESWDSSAGAGESAASGAIMQVVIDPSRPDMIYAASPGSGLYQSTDRAGTWKRVLTGPRVYAVAVHPSDSAQVVAAGSINGVGKVFKSGDSGQTWVEAYSESKASVYVSAIAFHPTINETVYAGLSTGEILRSTNTGVSWDVIGKLPDRVNSIIVSPTGAQTIFALALRGGLYRTTNGGGTWELLTKSLDGGSFQSFTLVESNSSAVYLGTSTGLYRTGNSGSTWEKLSLPLHEATTIVSAVSVNQKNADEVYAAVGSTFYKSTDAGRTWQTRALAGAGVVRSIVLDPVQSNLMYLGFGPTIN